MVYKIQFSLIHFHLDASLPGQYFFDRNIDGSLKKMIQGWNEMKNTLDSDPFDIDHLSRFVLY